MIHEEWGGPAQKYLDRLGRTEYEAFLRRKKPKKTDRFCPSEYMCRLQQLLGQNNEEGFKALKLLEGYANALGF